VKVSGWPPKAVNFSRAIGDSAPCSTASVLDEHEAGKSGSGDTQLCAPLGDADLCALDLLLGSTWAGLKVPSFVTPSATRNRLPLVSMDAIGADPAFSRQVHAGRLGQPGATLCHLICSISALSPPILTISGAWSLLN
jgi:hypothetical protein